MKKIGYFLIIIGFLTAAFVAVLSKRDVNWLFFSLALMAGALGVFLVRFSLHRSRRSREKITSSLNDIENAISAIVNNITNLNSQKQSINVYDIRSRIDELFSSDFEKFVDARESIAHKYGLQNYADVMNHFATGQRYLNRVWSASADGFVDEVNTYIEKASEQFALARQKISDIKNQT
jgi:RNase adaptor protein for sRNA GlmZ degradation